eukprot:maker-scaffold1219_size54854-snap-gene-0.5 protein:Tk12460 transcript:maker-scaffold1219_size54854-snap-gene-0.5-mRNA-1 annotation:"hypothetical protein"
MSAKEMKLAIRPAIGEVVRINDEWFSGNTGTIRFSEACCLGFVVLCIVDLLNLLDIVGLFNLLDIVGFFNHLDFLNLLDFFIICDSFDGFYSFMFLCGGVLASPQRMARPAGGLLGSESESRTSALRFNEKDFNFNSLDPELAAKLKQLLSVGPFEAEDAIKTVADDEEVQVVEETDKVQVVEKTDKAQEVEEANDIQKVEETDNVQEVEEVNNAQDEKTKTPSFRETNSSSITGEPLVIDPDNLPDGWACMDKVMMVEEIEYTDEERCTHIVEQSCHDTFQTRFKAEEIEECKEKFLKSCTIEYNAVPKMEKVEVCHQPMVRNCSIQGEEVCSEEYETVCDTQYHENEVEDDIPQCETTVTENVCDVAGKCTKVPRQECSLMKMNSTRLTPDTDCRQEIREVCGPEACPLTRGPKICAQQIKTFVQEVPEEICHLNPQKVCSPVSKIVPRLELEVKCIDVPREVCSTVQVEAKKVQRPTVKKWCGPTAAALVAPPEEALVAPPEEALVAPLEEALVAPPEEALVAPPEEALVALPEEALVAPPEEALVALPEEALVALPEEALVAPPEEALVGLPEEALVALPEEALVAPPEEVLVAPPEEVLVAPQEALVPPQESLLAPQEALVAP